MTAKKKTNASMVKQGEDHPDTDDANERTPLLGKEPRTRDVKPEGEVEDHRTKPSLPRVMIRIYGWTLLKAQLLHLFCDLLTFVGPLLQK